MNWLDGAIVRLAEWRGFHVSQEPPGWVDSLSQSETATGISVDESKALAATAVFACVRILAETVASLPLLVYRSKSDGGKERAKSHYLYPILHDIANPEMTSFELREALMGHVCLWGNAYGEIEFGGGQVLAIWPLRPDRMQVERKGGQLLYRYTVVDKQSGSRVETLPAQRVLHIHGLGFNGVSGYSVIGYGRQAVGLALATEEYGARFYGNNASPGGVLEHPGKLNEEAHKRMRTSWDDAHKGLSKSHRIAILEEGVTYKQVGIPPQDSQYLETRKFQSIEITRMYRVPPHMVGDLDRASFSNIEHQSIEFVTHTIRPWVVRWEQALNMDLLTPDERRSYFAEFLVDGLLRGDIQSRYQAYATARQNGWMSANDVRGLENMNPIEGGDVYLIPLNMVPAGQARAGLGSSEGQGQRTGDRGPGSGDRGPGTGDRGQQAMDGETLTPAPSADSGQALAQGEREGRAARSAQMRHRLEQAHRSVYRDALARVLRRERSDVGAAAKKMLGSRALTPALSQGEREKREQRSRAEFDLWLEQFYQEHGRFVYDQMAPVARTYGELVAAAAQEEVGEPDEMTPELEEFIHSYLAAYAARHGAMSRAEIRRALEKAQAEGLDALETVTGEMEDWPEARAAREGQDEGVRFGNALAKAVFVGAGILKLRWVAFGESCPYCTDLNGQVVGIQDVFLGAGVDFQPEGAESPLQSEHNVGHAPLHAGCDCMVGPG